MASLFLLLLLVVTSEWGIAAPESTAVSPQRCLLVFSYHRGYAWNDAIEEAAVAGLQGRCQIERFFMDSKRHPEVEWIQRKVSEVLLRIEQWRPDIILAVDDNVSKYLVVPYLKGTEIPVVFCGVNWTVEGYGYPDRNVTGMVEVNPIHDLIELSQWVKAQHIDPKQRSLQRVLFIDTDLLTSRKVFRYYRESFEEAGIELVPRMVRTFEAWKAAYLEGQSYDMVLVMNRSGIDGWDQMVAEHFVAEQGGVLSVASYDWMKEVAALTVAIVPAEQGEWAAAAMGRILSGTPVSAIPTVTNQRSQVFTQPHLLERAGTDCDALDTGEITAQAGRR